MKHDLVDTRDPQEIPASLAGFSVYLEVEPDDRGIVATVGVVNGGDHETPLLNPFGLVQLRLLDARGFPLRIPTQAPALRIHTAGGAGFQSPLPIVRVLADGRPAAAGRLEVEALDFGSHEEWSVGYLIDRIVAPGPPPVETPLPPGAYRVGSVATLIHAQRRGDTRILVVQPVETQSGPSR